MKWLKRILIPLIIILVILGITPLFIPSGYILQKVTNMVHDKTGLYLGNETKVKVTFLPRLAIVLKDLSLARDEENKNKIASLKYAKLVFNLSQLLSKQVEITEIDIKSLDADVNVLLPLFYKSSSTGDSNSNNTTTSSTANTKPNNSPSLTINTVSIKSSNLKYEGYKFADLDLEISGLTNERVAVKTKFQVEKTKTPTYHVELDTKFTNDQFTKLDFQKFMLSVNEWTVDGKGKVNIEDNINLDLKVNLSQNTKYVGNNNQISQESSDAWKVIAIPFAVMDKLLGSIEFTSNNLNFDKYKIEKIAANCKFDNDNANINITNLQAYSGLATAHLKISKNATNPQYNYEIKGSDFAIGSLPLFDNAKVKITGPVKLNLQGSGQARTLQDFLYRGSGNGNISLNNGQIIGLARVTPQQLAFTAPHIGNSIQLNSVNMNYTLSNGVINVKPATLVSELFSAQGSGSIRLQDQTIKFGVLLDKFRDAVKIFNTPEASIKVNLYGKLSDIQYSVDLLHIIKQIPQVKEILNAPEEIMKSPQDAGKVIKNIEKSFKKLF